MIVTQEIADRLEKNKLHVVKMLKPLPDFFEVGDLALLYQMGGEWFVLKHAAMCSLDATPFIVHSFMELVEGFDINGVKSWPAIDFMFDRLCNNTSADLVQVFGPILKAIDEDRLKIALAPLRDYVQKQKTVINNLEAALTSF